MANSFITRNFKWNGTSIKFPTEFTWGFQDISSKDTGRSLSGLMNKQIVSTKRTISCAWKMVSDADAAAILGAIKLHTYGTLTFPDPFEGADITKEFYSGDASAKMITVHEQKLPISGTVSKETFVWDITLDLIER